MPILRFNKNIPNLDDCVSHELESNGYLKIKIINIKFEEGYDDRNEMSLQIKEGQPNLQFCSFSKPTDYPANKMLNIDTCVFFENSNICFKIGFSKPFNFLLNYEYQK